jgi:hypothetical protein
LTLAAYSKSWLYMMNDGKVEADGLPTEMDLLMFNSAGVIMAVDTVQVDCIKSSEQAEQHGICSRALNEILGLGKEASPAFSTVILYKNGVEVYGLGVDELDAIVTVPTKAIQPIPAPLLYFSGPRLFWGVFLHGNNVVLLIDLYRLKGLKSYKAVATA